MDRSAAYQLFFSRQTKTTGHISLFSKLPFWAAVLLLATLSTRLFAFDLQLTVANDPVFGNSEGDDLYTAGLSLEVQRGFAHFSGGERMFTDREAGRRFDETYLTVDRRLASWGSWEPTVGFGVLHVGQGLLGQSVQNSLHDVIGSDLLDLDYPRRDRFFGELFARLERNDLFGRGRMVKTAIELRSAPGFRSWLRSMTSYEAPFGKYFSWRAGIGLHAEDANLPLLERNVEKVAPAGELGIAWRSLTLLWSYNDLGTATSHLTLGMNVPLRGLARTAAAAAGRQR